MNNVRWGRGTLDFLCEIEVCVRGSRRAKGSSPAGKMAEKDGRRTGGIGRHSAPQAEVGALPECQLLPPQGCLLATPQEVDNLKKCTKSGWPVFLFKDGELSFSPLSSQGAHKRE